MQLAVIAWVLCAAAVGSDARRDPVPGDSESAVVAALGEPRGWIRAQKYALLYYERGEIHLTNSVVSRVALVSDEEAKRRREERDALIEQRRLERERHIEEQQRIGRRVAAETLADPLFGMRSAAERVEFWTEFKRLYPGVDMSAPHQAALNELRKERQRAEQDARLKELEARVAAAERRATEAEALARRRQSFVISYPVYRYIVPWCVKPAYPRSSSNAPASRPGQSVIVPIEGARRPAPWQRNFFETRRRTWNTRIIPRH